MAKNILGLDLGTTSIGWAYVLEDENYENSAIKQIGVRVIPLTVDEQSNFEKGRPFSINAERTLKRGARRNLDRYKLRRENLIEILKANKIIDTETILTEDGKNTTHSTWALRAKAAMEKVSLEEFARILLAINKKRGYKSSRKAKNEDEGQIIDGMAVAKRLYEENLTPGELAFQILLAGKKAIPDFYRSDLQSELNKIWDFQQKYHPEILTKGFYKEIEGKGLRATSTAFWSTYGFNTAQIKDIEDSLKNEITVKLNLREKKRLQIYKWRKDALKKQLDKEEVATVIAEINNNINNSSGYLGAISDRSKNLYFNKQTIGQFLYDQLKKSSHTKLKNKVFYRQDYLDEFETIWETQAKYYSKLTSELKEEIRDVVIFYQRKLKSQKGLISFCEFEQKEITDKNGNKKIVGSRVIPRSSPLFQEFKIWQVLNNLAVRPKNSVKKDELYFDLEAKQTLFDELNIKGDLPSKTVLEILGYKSKDWEINYTKLEGNRTQKKLYEAYLKILELEGYDVKDLLDVSSTKDEISLEDTKKPAKEIQGMIKEIFESLKINTDILYFDAELEGKDYENQASFQLWHLLYSYEGDNSVSGNQLLYDLLNKKFGFTEPQARILANVAFLDDYGSLSTKAIRRIFPYIKESKYSEACELAGYRHSKHSLTSEELKDRKLKPKLELLKKNSLRQPVVEKILNQMINVVNALIDKENRVLQKKGLPENFHFDEIRIELARELKKNAKERQEMTTSINAANSEHEKIRNLLQNEFSIHNPSRNDIIRYKLYQELKNNGYKDLYTNTYIPREKIFSKEIDIEHIIPKSRVFDDSFSNKTLAYRKDNLEKGDKTAFDYIIEKYGKKGIDEYTSRVEALYKLGKDEGVSRAKFYKLIKTSSEIGDSFIERDLRETQYIAKKAKEILFEITPTVVSTSGKITDRLREDWGLINIMKEINLPKYRALGLTEVIERRQGQKIEVIKDWTKRNDHRHHAMDALTVAFTKHTHIQYLNYLNARKNELHKLHQNIIAIESKETELKIDDSGNNKRVFKEPLPNFRQVAKQHLDSVLIAHKAKNKVVTRNKNIIQGKKEAQITLTPRGQLHKETVYGKYHYYENKSEKISGKFDSETIEKVSNQVFKEALLKRLKENDNDPRKAFTGKNALSKNPIYLNDDKTEEIPEAVNLSWLEPDFSIRKDVNPDNFKNEKLIDKIVDKRIREIIRNRFLDSGEDSKIAFSDLEQNPIWLNQEKGISIKRVKISGVNNAEPLHYKKDHHGKFILNEKGYKQPVNFISTGNNHHVAIYRDDKGNLQENVVSFLEAVERVNQGLPIVDKNYKNDEGWTFLFTMKQNEFFVFPNEEAGFNPDEIDLLDPKNKALISPNLFRVQKFTIKDYFFRQHLETNVENNNLTKDILWKREGLKGIRNIIKVRLNLIGDIIEKGEY